MTETEWRAVQDDAGWYVATGHRHITGYCADKDTAYLIAAAKDMREAAQKLEDAELAHANCVECEGEIMPELCLVCFPLFDDARVTRRAALAKATPK